MRRSCAVPRRPRVRQRAGWTLLLAAILPLVTSCTHDSPQDIQIRIATGSATAVYYTFGQSLAAILNRELPGVRATVEVTAASAQNVHLVTTGQAELGFTQADVLPSSDDTGPPPLAIARVYDDLLHLVTTADSPIRRLSDLHGHRVSVGAPGSGTEITTTRLLTTAGLDGDTISRERLGLDSSVAALRDGKIDAFFFSGGLPVRAIEQLSRTTAVRLVDLGQWTDGLRRTYSEVYVSRDVPRSVYGLDPVTTVANPNYLIVSRNLPDSIVREVTRLLMERREELSRAHPAAARMNLRSAISVAPLALHPGAAEYYRSHKP